MSDNMSRKQVQQLIFAGPGKVDHQAIEVDLEPLEEERRDTNEGRKGRAGRPSAYVEVLEATVTTVINHDSRLLSDQEMNVLEHFSHFDYNTRYCLSRLVLRKAGHWHPISALERYKEEIGEEGLLKSIEVLCRRVDRVSREPLVKAEQVKLEPMDTDIPVKREPSPDVIDLTNDSDDEDIQNPSTFTTVRHAIHVNAGAGPSKIPTQDNDVTQNTSDCDPDEMDLTFFCEDESTMTLPEVLGRLTKDQLMILVKSTKCRLPLQAKKETIIQHLLSNADTQSVLNFATTPKKKGKGKPSDGFKQTQLSFAPRRLKDAPAKISQKDRLREMALEHLGKCVRVNLDFLRLLWRMHIISFRETSHPTSLFLPALLHRFKKWTFTDYVHNRSDLIWETRQDFLEYERALELEKVVDELLDPSSDGDVRMPTRTPAPNRDKFVTPAAPDSIRMFTTPSRTPASTSNLRNSQTPGVKQETVDTDCVEPVDEKLDQEKVEAQQKKAAKMERLKEAKKLLDDSIFPRWKCEVSIQNLQDNRAKIPGLERFETGYVYTRIVQKILGVCSQLKMYHHEFESFECLLAQRHWRRGKRAWWYERSAIIMGHIQQAAPKHEKANKLQETLDMIKDALLDDDTGIVWRPKLVRRLRALEKKLNVPPSERVQCEGELREAESITILADKIPPPLVDTNGRVINKDHPPVADLYNYISVSKQGSDKSPAEPAKKKTGKSTWYGRGKQIVNVETIALEHYEDNGFKGFHSETRILTMIFALLFWDIIFADVPGAFETPYQTAPLDMFEDTFFYSRRDLIEARLAELEQGKGQEILEKHDDKYRPRKVWCIGVRWDICEKADLLEIVECIGGRPLSMICRLFCEDYSSRRSGVPDLIVWNSEKRICKFVEVKGPGDSLQENQRLWVDSLLGADAKVEMCFVKDIKEPLEQGTSKKRKAKTPNPKFQRRKSAPAADPESEEEDYDQLDIHAEDLDQTDDLGMLPHPQKRRRTL